MRWTVGIVIAALILSFPSAIYMRTLRSLTQPPHTPLNVSLVPFHVDCAVCAEGYAPGVLSSCHECSTDDRRWTVGLGMAALSLAVLVVVVMVTYTLRGRRGEGSNRCSRNLKCCQNFVGRALPLSAIKIVVVVIQITTQVTNATKVVEPWVWKAPCTRSYVPHPNLFYVLL